jgi:hypothetical protein
MIISVKSLRDTGKEARPKHVGLPQVFSLVLETLGDLPH